jgi:uncharacterized Zn finger protein (UPF0148 family)
VDGWSLVRCPQCLGHGAVEAPGLGSRAHTWTWARCKLCMGHGRVPCPVCGANRCTLREPDPTGERFWARLEEVERVRAERRARPARVPQLDAETSDTEGGASSMKGTEGETAGAAEGGGAVKEGTRRPSRFFSKEDLRPARRAKGSASAANVAEGSSANLLARDERPP